MIAIKSRVISLAVLAAFVAAACGGYSKETISIFREHVGVRVPNQQRLLALSTDEAVARLDFKGLTGKKVVIEMAGIFPHTRADVLDYIQGQVEAKIARDGGLVISAGQLVVAPMDGSGSADPAHVLSLTPGDADFRVIIGVSWAGVDTHDRKIVNTALLTRQLLVIGGGMLLSVLGATGVADDPTASLIVSGLGVGGIGGGIAWTVFDKPTLHIFRLLGRVRLSVNAIPVVPGGTAFQTVGEGQTELTVDPTAEEGYVIQ